MLRLLPGDGATTAARFMLHILRRGSIRGGDRTIDILLTALPMGVPVREVADPLSRELASRA